MTHHDPMLATRRISRRGLLQVGSLACLGLDLAGFFRGTGRCREPSGTSGSARRTYSGGEGRVRGKLKSVILIFCDGGPSHIDTFDMKPEGPAEIRGEFRPIKTSVPGRHVCEHLPRTARVMHRVHVIRSMNHRMRGHRSGVTNALTGLPPALGDVCIIAPDPLLLPSFGSRISYLLRGESQVLPHVALPYTVRDSGIVLPGQSAGFLGPAYDRLQVEGDPNSPDFSLSSLKLPAEVTLDRLEHRESLLGLIDAQQEGLTRHEGSRRLDAAHRKAVHLLTASGVRRAFELTQESPKTREWYGRNIVGQSVLLARRLVEAGVRFVTVNIGDQTNEWYWDDHKDVFGGHKRRLAPFDRAFAALIEDLHDHGLLDSTLVISLGEFGRTPTINKDVGRDHWPDCYCAVLAGGGVKGGDTYGASDKIGGYPSADPVGPGDFAATLFSRFGLDATTELVDSAGRPFRLAEGAPIAGLFEG